MSARYSLAYTYIIRSKCQLSLYNHLLITYPCMSFDRLTSPLSPTPSISSSPTFSPPTPRQHCPLPVNPIRRRSPLSDAIKLDKVFECLRTDVYWSVSDFLRVLAATEGPVNIRRKTAFAAAAYKDSEVLGLYLGDEDQLWNGVRESVIQALDLGNNELW